MRKLTCLLALLLIAGGCQPAAERQQWAVNIVRVIDGDTVEILWPNGIYDRVRLAGIDAPERGEDGYDTATEALTNMTDGHKIVMTLPADRQRGCFGRLLGTLWLEDGRSINDILLAERLVEPYRRP